MRIKTRLFIVIILLVLSNLVVGMLGIFSLRNTIVDNQYMDKLSDMQYIAKQIEFRMAGQSNDERGLLLTGDKQFAKQMEEKSAEIRRSCKNYENYRNPLDYKMIDEISKNYDEYWSASQQVIATIDTDPEKAKEIHFLEGRKIRKEVLDPSFDQFIVQLDKEDVQVQETLKSESDFRGMMLLVISILAALLGIILGVSILRAILRPLHQLKEQMNHISKGDGDLTKSITVKNHDEFGEVAASFNQFVQSLREMVSRIGHSSEQVATSSENF